MMNLLHPFEIEIAGRQLFFERTLDLARRIESVAGPLMEFAQRLDRGRVTYTEVARVYAALTRDDPGAPDVSAIDEWLFRVGLFVHQRCAAFIASLTAGSESLAQEARRLPAGKETGRGPFVPAA